ncbi:MAG: hypothetical protein GX971_08200, partial [Firmicutes bacterium]|nr:hypothetical protein [Bacillota bacterium]
MRHFLRLLRKDLEASRLPVGFLSGITLIIMLFVRFKISSGAWAAENFVAAVAIPVAFMPLWLIWQSFQTLRSEWREDTVYTLLVLPVAGWKVMLAKLVSIWVEYSVLCVATVGGTLIFFGTFLEELFRALPSVSWAIWNGFMVYLLGLAILSSVVIFVQ